MNARFGNLINRIAAAAGRRLILAVCVVVVALLLTSAAVRLLHSLAGPVPHTWAGLAVAQEATCGNGVLDPGEQCDDGNTEDGDCCSATCQFEPAGSSCTDYDQCTDPDTCDGNGVCVSGPPVVCPPADPCHEDGVCDSNLGGCWYSPKPDGTPCDDGMACSFDDQCVGGVCSGTVPTCGDGIVESQGGCEQCDDGNTQGGDGCSANCKLEPSGRMCQQVIGRGVNRLLSVGLQALKRCRSMLNTGKAQYCDQQPLTDPAECPNECHAATAIQRANRLAQRTIARSCTDTTARGLGACANTVDGLIGPHGDTGCLNDASALAADALVAQDYGQLTTGDPALTQCQQAIGLAGSVYARALMLNISSCRNTLNRNLKLFFDKGRTQRLTDPADCPNEFRTKRQDIAAGVSAYAEIAGGDSPPCTDALVASLGLCASTIDGLVSSDGTGGCLLAEHSAQVNAVIQAAY